MTYFHVRVGVAVLTVAGVAAVVTHYYIKSARVVAARAQVDRVVDAWDLTGVLAEEADPWGNPLFALEHRGEVWRDRFVRSAGPDGESGTADDIAAGRSAKVGHYSTEVGKSLGSSSVRFGRGHLAGVKDARKDEK